MHVPTLLVVDDEPMILAALTAAFELDGEVRVVTRECPLAALAYLEQHGADVVICDFLMPRLDGIEVLRRARAIDPRVPRILLTGYADKDSALRAINEAGIFHYVEKPWTCADLRRVVRDALEQRRVLSSLGDRAAELTHAKAHLDALRCELLRSFG